MKKKRMSENAIQSGERLKARPGSHSNDEDDAPPVKKKKKKPRASGGNMLPMFIAIGAGVFLLLLAGGGAAGYFFWYREPPEASTPIVQARPEDNKPPEQQKAQIFNKLEDGSPTKKGGKGVIQGVRGAVWRTERRNELANINKYHTAFVLEYKKSQQTLENFLEYMKRDFKTGHDAVKEGYYIVNVKADPGTATIVAGERDLDLQGHLAVFTNGEIRYVPQEQWKKAMGIP